MSSDIGSAAGPIPVNIASDHGADGKLRSLLVGFFRRRIADPHEVDDLVQEVFVRLLRRGGFTEADNVTAYAYRVAQSVLLDRGRYRTAHSSDHHVEFDPDLHAETGGQVDEAFFARQMLQDAALALGRLPERTRHVFLLRRVDGLAMREIADQLGISISSAEKHLQRATLHLVKVRGRSQ